ncbi:MAG TPA: hypothetical protein PLD84_02640 [Chitinophagales bacterium]|nr:hypothetical protein [Chitinophagales bacterium]
MKYQSVVGVLIVTFLFISCQPKANISTINDPMSGFTANVPDSTRGAATLQELSSYLFLSLKDDITFEQLTKFFPDSGNVAMIYEVTNADAKGVNLRSIADSAQNQLRRGWLKTHREAAELKVNWTDATFTTLRVMDIENQKIPSKKIMLECKSGTQTLRASARCLMIGNRWFIGEDIKFGV